jgi:hypothetical protein
MFWAYKPPLGYRHFARLTGMYRFGISTLPICRSIDPEIGGKLCPKTLKEYGPFTQFDSFSRGGGLKS